ncbi:response regulator [Desulfobacterales bacterium HSG17]|nr:response regulator [Desulfobacterales bacterium HSG17]
MSKSKILIVEDDGIVAMDIESRLENFGYDVCGKVAYAEKAIEKAKELEPDLILMDIVLKGEMDGIEAAKIIQSQFYLPIVFLTAHADEKKIERAKVINPFGYILKPFRDRELKIIIEMALYKVNADKRIKESEEKYRQAQKMESIGRLAGGVAHDYNNALSVIMGFTELALEEIEPEGQLHEDLTEVLVAAKRAAGVTRQLLAFARKQTISPVVLDLNRTVEDMLKMLRRLIGEDINLIWMPQGDLWLLRMDPSQIDQIMANLCVNARDAIKGVGELIVETSNISLDEAYCELHKGFIPGEFIQLAVSDNGCGMDKETVEKIFEPFFTTKPVDKGTGLGMATVYGITKQNKGFINVYSEKDKGTTVKLYLPRHEGQEIEEQDKTSEEIPQGQGETILVVEDELSVLNFAEKLLKILNYTVLTAQGTKEALMLSREYKSEIQLLLTDVIMPEMNGQELTRQVQSFYPDIKSIFMSGYTPNAIAHQGVLDDGVNFIQKPFSKIDLAKKIREALDTQAKK